VTLESLGVPTVNFVSDEFEKLFLLESEQQGMALLPYVVVPHPIGGVREAVAVAKARAAAPAFYRALTEGRPR
jgi:hypothetical protein